MDEERFLSSGSNTKSEREQRIERQKPIPNVPIDKLVCDFKFELDEFIEFNDRLINGHDQNKIKTLASHEIQLKSLEVKLKSKFAQI